MHPHPRVWTPRVLHCGWLEEPSGDSLWRSMALLAPGLDPRSPRGLPFFWLPLLPLLLTAGGRGQGPLPRVIYQAGDGRRVLSLFHQKGLQDFDTLLLSDDGGTLYVGAREAILALNIQDPGIPRLKNMIPWPASERKKSECTFKRKSNETQCFNFIRVLVSLNATHLYACGTFAFSPACTFIELQDSYLMPISEDKVVEGKGQSPFDPAHKHTAVLADGMLYSGTMNNFLGSEPILIRTLGPQPVLKTDNFLRWLQPDASFVAAIPSTQFVYFFFEETASEFEFFEKLHTSRVARVCKVCGPGGSWPPGSQWGGGRGVAELAQPGQLPFNVIRHAVLLPAAASADARVYAAFSSQWQVGGTRSSAVCAFSLKDFKRVFEGKYKELNKETSRWTTYGVPEISPRPGSCSVGPSSDKALTFMKDHFLMDEQVVGTPVLVKSGVEYTRLAVETVQGVGGHSHLVLYLGTSECQGRGRSRVWELKWELERGVGAALPPPSPLPEPLALPSPPVKEVLAAPNSIVELPCPHLSALASYGWTRGKANGALLLLLRDGAGGLYQCWATENGFSHPVASYWVHSQDRPLALDPELAGIPRERVEAPLTRVSGEAAPAAQRSYWPHFVTVTVLLALVLCGALLLLLASPLGALRARGKVQGCGTLPPGEKAPLSRKQHPQPPKDRRTSAGDVDADNNHLGPEVA
ncbi:LOW QUALITY PROTEIN: semaphorin-4A [Crocuta crocuta]